MSSLAQRTTILALVGLASVVPAAPAAAQANREAVLNILVECAKIDDPTARLACYDANIRNAGGVVRTPLGRGARVQGGGAPGIVNEGPQGFGRENIRSKERFEAPAGQLHSIRPKVTAIKEREPGVYLLTLEDGAQWLFADSVNHDYRLPRVGSILEIERGALGSFLMRFDGQPPVQVRRVQ
jgi:hypothetical protein